MCFGGNFEIVWWCGCFFFYFWELCLTQKVAITTVFACCCSFTPPRLHPQSTLPPGKWEKVVGGKDHGRLLRTGYQICAAHCTLSLSIPHQSCLFGDGAALNPTPHTHTHLTHLWGYIRKEAVPVKFCKFPKPTIWHSHPLHSTAGQLCWGETVSRDYVSFYGFLFHTHKLV